MLMDSVQPTDAEDDSELENSGDFGSPQQGNDPTASHERSPIVHF